MPDISLLEFADKMSRIMPVIIKGFAKRQTNELYKGKITLPQFLILEVLNREGEPKMSGLARIMGVSTAAVTGLVDRLVNYGYVVRVFDSRDRRIIRIKLTAGGLSLVRKVSQQRRQMIISIFGKISETDRRDYLRILMQIKEILSQPEAQGI